MSQFIQHPAESLKLSFAARRAAWLLSIAVLAAVAAVAVVLLVSNGDNSSSASTPASSNTAAPVTRYDGGPEEGTAGVATPAVILHSQPLSRRGVIGGRARPFHGGGFIER